MYGENNRPAMFKMELDGLRAQMQAMIMDRHADMERCVNAGIDVCIASLPEQLANDAKKMSKEIIEDAMRKALVEYWESGKGRDLIDSAIHAKFKNTKL